jgi:hypothetical protein
MDAHPIPRRNATIIWSALVAGVLLFLAVAMTVPMPGAPALAPVMLAVGGGLSVVTIAMSWLWAVRLPPSSTTLPAAAPDALALTRLVLASALCEGSALFALVAYLVTQDVRTLVPFALSLGSLLAHFPGDRHWARLSGAPAPRGPGRHPMMRG